ncbi:uncharacterized protein LOC123683843 isoform X1 [Harmonia axyridis]|uniref:uncharacterized protein LOC123683843 isoform X1 n=1 Tax=Harmonia axyridis TaxID=115357 RepID=UPI001E2797A9|nr:uncharacterized protein LOC123683843 isoform X1 [Harmonia axyridis]
MRDYLCTNLNSQMNAQSLTMVSTNGYYGYQPVINPPDNRVNEYQNQMEVDSHNFCENVYMDTNIQPFSRKRQNPDPIDVQTFKKRRQNEYIPAFTQNKENVSNKEKISAEELLAQTHGGSLHHWKRENDL